MFNRKVFTAILIVTVAGLVLAACMRNDASDNPAAPSATADYAPQATGGAGGMNNGAGGVTGSANPDGAAGTNGAGNTSTTANGALNPFDWANGAADIEQAIGQISEVAEARVVVVRTTALVGVKFDNAYKGEMTERIREMVASEVLRADPTIQTVAVTADAEDVKKVYDLSEQIRAGRTADELAADINSIVRNATTLR